jgi:hypothetical protein
MLNEKYQLIQICKKYLTEQSVPRIINVFNEMPRNHIVEGNC